MQENMINQNSAIMSEETEISRDFLTNETSFSEDKTNANIINDYISMSDGKIISLFGTEEEINKSWPSQVPTNFIKKGPGINKWQDRNPDIEFFIKESVNEEKTNENAFHEYDSIKNEKFMKNQPKPLDSSKEKSNVNIIKVDPMKEIPNQIYCFKQSPNLLNIQSTLENTSSKSTVILHIEDGTDITQQYKKENTFDGNVISNSKSTYLLINGSEKCPKYDKRFTQKGHMKEHFEAFHEKKKMHICSNCGVSFGEKSSLKEHISLVHEGKKGLLNDGKCPRCDKQFVHKDNILKHIKAVHEKIRPYKCPICNKGFTEKTHLKLHIEAVHEGKKPHICPKCGVGFGKKSSLTKHVSSVHEGKKPHPTKQYKCSICNKIFPHQGNLSRHIRAVHEGKKFSCVMCEASFWENNGLKRHVALTHEQIVPFVCSICSAPYISKSSLEKHFARCVFQEQQRKKQMEQAY